MKNKCDFNSTFLKSVDVIAPTRNDDGTISTSIGTILSDSAVFNRPVPISLRYVTNYYFRRPNILTRFVKQIKKKFNEFKIKRKYKLEEEDL